MRFDFLLIGFLMISLFAIGGAMMISDINAQYAFAGVNVSDSEFQNVYDKANATYAIAQDAEKQTLKADIEGGSTSLDSMLKGSYSALRLVGSTFGFFTELVNALAASLGVPRYFVTVFFAMFIVTVVFSLIYMLFRYVAQ